MLMLLFLRALVLGLVRVASHSSTRTLGHGPAAPSRMPTRRPASHSARSFHARGSGLAGFGAATVDVVRGLGEGHHAAARP